MIPTTLAFVCGVGVGMVLAGTIVTIVRLFV
jgi:hypothetical protein